MYSRNSNLEEDDEPVGRDREIALGTSFIVGIFFALVLICAIFFAFGYSLGRRSALPASGVAPAPAAPSPGTGASMAKPSSGIPEPQSAPASSSTNADTSDASDGPLPSQPAATQAPAAVQAPVVLPAKLNVKTAPASRPAVPAAVPASSGTAIVQVAAVSRLGDADMLMSALKRRGYNATVRQVAQDKLLHVQIGPFATKKDAEAMRQRLIADGYNAIVK
jgi:cell division septation protein DedD